MPATLIAHLRRPYVYLIFAGILASEFWLEYSAPEYRSTVCQALQTVANQGAVSGADRLAQFCAEGRPPLQPVTLAILAFFLTSTAVAILPPPEPRKTISDQAAAARTLEDQAQPNLVADVEGLVRLWRELSIRARQFRIVVLMCAISPFLFLCFTGIDSRFATHLVGGGQSLLELVLFGALYVVTAVIVSTYAIYGFSGADFTRLQLSVRIAAGGMFYAGLTSLLSATLSAPAALLGNVEYWGIRLIVAPVLVGGWAAFAVPRVRVATSPLDALQRLVGRASSIQILRH